MVKRSTCMYTFKLMTYENENLGERDTQDAEELIRKAFGSGVTALHAQMINPYNQFSTMVGGRGVVDASMHEIGSGAAQLVRPCGDNEPFYAGLNAPKYPAEV